MCDVVAEEAGKHPAVQGAGRVGGSRADFKEGGEGGSSRVGISLQDPREAGLHFLLLPMWTFS